MVEVLPPRIVAVQRGRPDRITLGDTATAEEGPELLQLLMRPFGGNNWPLGRGIHPMTTVPLGLAIDAAIEAAGGHATNVSTLRYATFSMEAFTSNRRPLRAIARIAALAARHVEADVQVWEVEPGAAGQTLAPERPRPPPYENASRRSPGRAPAPGSEPPQRRAPGADLPGVRLVLTGRIGLVRVRSGRAAPLASALAIGE